MEFRAPDNKTFTISSESGSGLVRKMALHPLIPARSLRAAGKKHHDSAISPANYSLEIVGEQQIGPYHCFVAQAIPKRKDKYLFEGKLWIVLASAKGRAVCRRPPLWKEGLDDRTPKL